MSDLSDLASQSKAISAAISAGIMSTVSNAAESITLANGVALIEARMEAVTSALETIAVQKDALLTKRDAAKGALKAAYARQIELLSEQEESILARIGVKPEPTKPALTARRASLGSGGGSRAEALAANGVNAHVESEQPPF